MKQKILWASLAIDLMVFKSTPKLSSKEKSTGND